MQTFENLLVHRPVAPPGQIFGTQRAHGHHPGQTALVQEHLLAADEPLGHGLGPERAALARHQRVEGRKIRAQLQGQVDGGFDPGLVLAGQAGFQIMS